MMNVQMPEMKVSLYCIIMRWCSKSSEFQSKIKMENKSFCEKISRPLAELLARLQLVCKLHSRVQQTWLLCVMSSGHTWPFNLLPNRQQEAPLYPDIGMI